MDELDKLLLTVVNKNARVELEDLAMMLDTNVDEVKKRLSKLEKDKVICGYQTVTNWDRTDLSQVTALIEVSVIPERKYGYNRIASKIYRFEEVETMYLLSGKSDLLCIVRGKTMQQIAEFVATRLSSIEGVTDTTTTFVLKSYKNAGVILVDDEDSRSDRLVVSM